MRPALLAPICFDASRSFSRTTASGATPRILVRKRRLRGQCRHRPTGAIQAAAARTR
jgi:hypothetical protein